MNKGRLRAQLRRLGVSEQLIGTVAPTRQARKRLNQAAWQRPQCTGVTKQGVQCRRGAICDRKTRQAIGEAPLCRLHGGMEALVAALQQQARELTAALEGVPT